MEQVTPKLNKLFFKKGETSSLNLNHLETEKCLIMVMLYLLQNYKNSKCKKIIKPKYVLK